MQTGAESICFYSFVPIVRGLEWMRHLFTPCFTEEHLEYKPGVWSRSILDNFTLLLVNKESVMAPHSSMNWPAFWFTQRQV